ncbi:hypothetical protein [Empedobacter brevis]|uniref:hypothetical protein n=1 Tax=Empedobacter brevis TaxID=247 RepID=UPI002FE0AC99
MNKMILVFFLTCLGCNNLNNEESGIYTTITKKENNSIFLEINNKSDVELNIMIPKNKFLCHNLINSINTKYKNYISINLTGEAEVFEVVEGAIETPRIEDRYQLISIKPEHTYEGYFFIPTEKSPCSSYHKINDKYIGVYLFKDKIISKSNFIHK